MSNGPDTSSSPNIIALDAVIIGAGFGGLRMVHEMRRLGLSFQAFEAGSDVGGTWYWNRYPGARTDSEAWVYCFSFSKEIMDEWDWQERMPSGPQVLEYLRFVADRLDMRKHIKFDTRIQSARFVESTSRWIVTADDGQQYSCTYLIAASGLLTVPYTPQFKGLANFKGDWYLSSRWPKDNVDFKGKRVAIIGSGSTAVQMLPVIAHSASNVTMFQRTANFVLPGRNYALDDDERGAIRERYDHIWSQVRQQVFAFAMEPAGRVYDSVDDAERQRILEAGWETGGFRYIFETFDDILVDERSNDAASDFVRGKIRAIVKDPDTAELLCPTHGLLSKRPALCNFYYEAFNRDNVALVDVSRNPIEEITETGIKVDGKDREFDIIIFATGFDAGTGALTAMDIRGRDGITIREKWSAGPRTHLGTMVDDFPNLFLISGPQSPFANIPPIIEYAARWIGHAIEHARQHGDRIEPSSEAVEHWSAYMKMLVDATLLRRGEQINSWFLGANIPGKAHAVLFYFGGAGRYFDELEDSVDKGFVDFKVPVPLVGNNV